MFIFFNIIIVYQYYNIIIVYQYYNIIIVYQYYNIIIVYQYYNIIIVYQYYNIILDQCYNIVLYYLISLQYWKIMDAKILSSHNIKWYILIANICTSACKKTLQKKTFGKKKPLPPKVANFEKMMFLRYLNLCFVNTFNHKLNTFPLF